ncbi:MAG: hypothetical protein C0171_03700 [Caldisphaera sp.]|uniref:PolB1-binding protein PBP2 family protein n=1 Tax=Caldisphaera sp. TaxID=2060322 RepID=UPI000CBD20BC|nr:hypothetical protein [Caldisphaera sp.]PMP60126.1 MAG: hypothetical protein C0201_03430 [Caldisphaera sp.]PMP91011.1 MAG: hypothetical protein C0171_03700 [Caldisphaera sp.]
METWLIESSKILEKARNLSDEEKKVFRYFLENISVGDLRAVMDLNRKGIKNSIQIIESLVSNGLLERGNYCYSLPYNLRVYISIQGPPDI